MSRDLERSKVIMHFQTLWISANGPIAIPNQPFTTPANSMYVVLNIVERGSFRKSLGSDFFKRHNSTFQIDIYAPADTGTKKSRQIADQLEPVYQDLILFLTDGETLKFGTPNARVLALNEQRASNLEDNWDRYVIECPYYRDQFVEN